MPPIPVTFTDLELLGCYTLAASRNTKRPGVASRKMDARADDLTVNYVAVKAEYAVQRLTGAPVVMALTPGGGGSTCMTVAGRRAIVRASDDLLIFTDLALFEADIAILVSPWGDARDPYSSGHPRHWRRDVAVKGYITRDEFAARAQRTDLGYGPRLVVRDGVLHPLTELVQPAPVASQLSLLAS